MKPGTSERIISPLLSSLVRCLLLQTLIRDGDHDGIVHPLQQHLTSEIDHAALLGALESAHQSLVVLLDVVVVEEVSEFYLGRPRFPDPLNVQQELLDLVVEALLP